MVKRSIDSKCFSLFLLDMSGRRTGIYSKGMKCGGEKHWHNIAKTFSSVTTLSENILIVLKKSIQEFSGDGDSAASSWSTNPTEQRRLRTSLVHSRLVCLALVPNLENCLPPSFVKILSAEFVLAFTFFRFSTEFLVALSRWHRSTKSAQFDMFSAVIRAVLGWFPNCPTS